MSSSILAIPADPWSHYIAPFAGPSAVHVIMVTCRALLKVLRHDDVWHGFLLASGFSTTLVNAGIQHGRRIAVGLRKRKGGEVGPTFDSDRILRWVYWGLLRGRLFFTVRPAVYRGECSCELCIAGHKEPCKLCCVDLHDAGEGVVMSNSEAAPAVQKSFVAHDKAAASPPSCNCHAVFARPITNEGVYDKWNESNSIITHLACAGKATVFTYGSEASYTLGKFSFSPIAPEPGLMVRLCNDLIAVFGCVVMSAIGIHENGIGDLFYPIGSKPNANDSRELRNARRLKVGTTADGQFGFVNAQEKKCSSTRQVENLCKLFERNSREFDGFSFQLVFAVPIIRVKIPATGGSILFGTLPGRPRSQRGDSFDKRDQFFRKQLSVLDRCMRCAAMCDPIPIRESVLTQVFGDVFTGKSRVDIFGVSGPAADSKCELELTIQSLDSWFGFGISTLMSRVAGPPAKRGGQV